MVSAAPLAADNQDDQHTPPDPPAPTAPPSADDASTSGPFGHDAPTYRSSTNDTTRSPLPDAGPPKVFPVHPRVLGATPRLPNLTHAPASGPQGAGVGLEQLPVNHDTLLQHFSLRKRSSSYFPTPKLLSKPVLSSAPTRWSLSRVMKRLRRRGAALVTGIVNSIAPSGWFMAVRQAVVLLAVLFEVLFVPFAGLVLAGDEFREASQSALRRINMAVEAILISDCALGFNTALHETKRGHLVVILRRLDIAKAYVRGSFAADLLGSLPVECISALSSSVPLVARLPVAFHVANALRLLRVRCLLHAKRAPWATELLSAAAARCQACLGVKCVVLQTMLSMTLLLAVTAHYLACVWHAILITFVAPRASSDADPATLEAMKTMSSSRLADRYFACLLHVLCAIFGHASVTGVAVADAFHALLVVVGVQAFAYFVGALSVLVSNTSYSTHSKFQRKLQSLASKMDKLQLPADLQKRVQQYYAHLWAEYDTLSGDVLDFSRELSRPLALEVGLYRYMPLATRVPFWSDGSPDFVSAVILGLQVRVFLRDDFVVRRGEVGAEMFMIHRGVGERAGAGAAGHEAVRLTNGNYVAEMAVLMDYKRATSVRALSHMELCVLARPCFLAILARYHHERRRVVTRIVRAGLESKDYPEMWQDVVLLRARQGCRQSDKRLEKAGPAESPSAAERCSSDEELSPDEAAELLVDAMNVDDGFASPLVLKGGARRSTRVQSGRDAVDHDEGQRRHPETSSSRSRQSNSSSASSNGRRLERRSRSVVVRSQDALSVSRSAGDLPPAAPSSADSVAVATTRPGLEAVRSSSLRSVQSTVSVSVSVARNSRSAIAHRLVHSDSAQVKAPAKKESTRLLQELMEGLARLEQRVIQMDERGTSPLLQTLQASPCEDDKPIELQLPIETSSPVADQASKDHADDDTPNDRPSRRDRDRRYSMDPSSAGIERGQGDGHEATPPKTELKTRRSQSLSTPAELAFKEWQAQVARKAADESARAAAPRANRFSSSSLADSLWKSVHA